jgi:hypothetical protein
MKPPPENGALRCDVNSGWWQPVLFTAMAGGMGWGIRGQYGHETGAMIAGLLVSLTLAILFCDRLQKSQTIRAVAWGTVAMGIGGSMTYGQTVGLTHDSALVGNMEALRWGLLGLAIKGSLWIGFCGVFLGMGLSGVSYRIREILFLTLSLVAAYVLGLYLLNSPHDPANRLLPTLYFSAHWYWEPDKALKPRPECWGGLLLGIGLLLTYVGAWRKDRLALRLGLFGLLGGALGFPMGQSVQAWHAWNPEIFNKGYWASWTHFINWWNMMEITFGAVMGAVLGLGLWLNKALIQNKKPSIPSYMPAPIEWALLVIHIPLLFMVEFMALPAVDLLYDPGVVLAWIPLVAITAGRWWPYLLVLPITLLPIAGKTFRQLILREEVLGTGAGVILYGVLPLLLFTGFALFLGKKATEPESNRQWLRTLLLLTAWMYFLLNYAFFRFPWPWAEWTGRTPSAIIFTVCIIGLTGAALFAGKADREASG